MRAPSAEPLELAIDLIGELRDKLPIDPKRVYVTGFSMGGFGSWIAISRHPDLFAAPGAHRRRRRPVACRRRTQRRLGLSWHEGLHRARPPIPLHGRRPARRRRHPRYTEYADKGHFIIREALGEPELVDWLFSQEADWLP
ncbi:MAG: alpha/beta hydrolase-fold protein [Bryobacterales bacterium]